MVLMASCRHKYQGCDWSTPGACGSRPLQHKCLAAPPLVPPPAVTYVTAQLVPQILAHIDSLERSLRNGPQQRRLVSGVSATPVASAGWSMDLPVGDRRRSSAAFRPVEAIASDDTGCRHSHAGRGPMHSVLRARALHTSDGRPAQLDRVGVRRRRCGHLAASASRPASAEYAAIGRSNAACDRATWYMDGAAFSRDYSQSSAYAGCPQPHNIGIRSVRGARGRLGVRRRRLECYDPQGLPLRKDAKQTPRHWRVVQPDQGHRVPRRAPPQAQQVLRRARRDEQPHHPAVPHLRQQPSCRSIRTPVAALDDLHPSAVDSQAFAVAPRAHSHPGPAAVALSQEPQQADTSSRCRSTPASAAARSSSLRCRISARSSAATAATRTAERTDAAADFAVRRSRRNSAADYATGDSAADDPAWGAASAESRTTSKDSASVPPKDALSVSPPPSAATSRASASTASPQQPATIGTEQTPQLAHDHSPQLYIIHSRLSSHSARRQQSRGRSPAESRSTADPGVSRTVPMRVAQSHGFTGRHLQMSGEERRSHLALHRRRSLCNSDPSNSLVLLSRPPCFGEDLQPRVIRFAVALPSVGPKA